MRGTSNNNRPDDEWVFCHFRIEMLVRADILTPEIASQISLDEYEASALSDPLIFRLVLNEMMYVESALMIPKEMVEASAIFNRHIYHLVELGRMPAEQALAMPREEVEDPLPYLRNKPDKSPEQMRKLELYENCPNIDPDYVEMIVLLEFNMYRMPSEDRELALLLNEQTRAYAFRITELEFYSSHTTKNLRELDLLYDFYARDYAQEIANLEFQTNITTDEALDLESLYLRVCCKIPYESPASQMFKEALEAEGIIQPDNLQAGCGRALMFGPAVPSALVSMGIFSTNSQPLMNSMKSFIDRLIRKELIPCYFEVNHIPARFRETEQMQSYVDDKVCLLRFGILKYFTSSKTPEYSENNLRTLIEMVREKLVTKELMLNCHESIMNLEGLFQEESQMLPGMR